jgi:hypothetical protein
MTARGSERVAFAQDAIRALLAHVSGEQVLPGLPPPDPVGPQLPTRADLDAATAATLAVLADPSATLADINRAHVLEAAVYDAAPEELVVQAELETEAEAGI